MLKFYPNKNFEKHEYHNGILWVAGSSSKRKRGKWHISLSRRELPELKSNNSIVWLNTEDNFFVAQVDHLSTYPLWYNDDTTEIWSTWDDVEQRNFEPNKIFYAMRDLFLGTMTVGSHSPYEGVERVLPDHCIRNGTVMRYTHSFDLTKSVPPTEEWGNILNQCIVDNCSDGDVLMFSGGRDSTTIANFAIYNNIDLKYIHITSNRNKPDSLACKDFAERAGINVQYIDPRDIKNVYTSEDKYWHDGSFPFKYNALTHVKGTTGITGEFGASERGHQTINYIHQSRDLTLEKLINIHISTLESRNDSCANTAHMDGLIEGVREHARMRELAWEYVLDYFNEIYEELLLNATNDREVFAILLSVMRQEHESYRLFGYSQDMDHNWKHPLADWRWCNIIDNTDPIARQTGAHERLVYKMAASQYDWFIDSAWKFGKPRGLGSL